jgi:hypothetical protein
VKSGSSVDSEVYNLADREEGCKDRNWGKLNFVVKTGGSNLGKDYLGPLNVRSFRSKQAQDTSVDASF